MSRNSQTLVDQPPARSGWIHRVKHDGYRTLLVVERGKDRAYTRNGFDWTDRYPGIVQAAADLKCRSAILDGEVMVQDEHGTSDFDALMSAKGGPFARPRRFGTQNRLWLGGHKWPEKELRSLLENRLLRVWRVVVWSQRQSRRLPFSVAYGGLVMRTSCPCFGIPSYTLAALGAVGLFGTWFLLSALGMKVTLLPNP